MLCRKHACWKGETDPCSISLLICSNMGGIWGACSLSRTLLLGNLGVGGEVNGSRYRGLGVLCLGVLLSNWKEVRCTQVGG